MIYHWLANTVLVVHGLFIVFVLLGGLLVFWKRWIAWLHLPIAVYGVLVEWVGWICPLTPLENHFRRLAGAEGYTGGFIQHYLLPLIYPANYTPMLQWLLGGAVLAVNVIVYASLVRKLRRSRGGQATR